MTTCQRCTNLLVKESNQLTSQEEEKKEKEDEEEQEDETGEESKCTYIHKPFSFTYCLIEVQHDLTSALINKQCSSILLGFSSALPFQQCSQGLVVLFHSRIITLDVHNSPTPNPPIYHGSNHLLLFCLQFVLFFLQTFMFHLQKT